VPPVPAVDPPPDPEFPPAPSLPPEPLAVVDPVPEVVCEPVATLPELAELEAALDDVDAPAEPVDVPEVDVPDVRLAGSSFVAEHAIESAHTVQAQALLRPIMASPSRAGWTKIPQGPT